MSNVTNKKKRCRIQFTIHSELHEMYIAYKAHAKKLGVSIELHQNFEEWFENLLKQEGNRIGLKLKMLEARAEEDVIYIKPATVRTDDLKITELLAADGLPKTGFVLLSNIIGDPKGTPPIPAIMKEQLMQLPGIGEVKAQEIIKTRKKLGKLKSADDLLKVNGIGDQTLKGIRKHVKF